MNLSELLEGLKAVDPETWHDLILWDVNTKLPETSPISMYIIQGCIQQACERRGWEIEQNYRIRGRDGNLPKNMRHYAVITSWDKDVHTYRGMGNSATKALLAAYIAAVKGEKK